MTEQTMVERVARAMLADELKGTAHSFEKAWINEDVVWLSNARAAIEAMREPTEGMVEAGWNASGEVGERFTAMIDAALGEGGE